jgi:transposase
MEIRSLGIDLAKNVFQLHGRDCQGRPVLEKKLTRVRFSEQISKLAPCTIGLEAGSGSHHWARKFTAMGHEVRVMPPQYVKPFVKTNKNDVRDAEAICEAMGRPNMRFVSVKTVQQQKVQATLRIRQRLVEQRTALINEIRGILTEFGIVMARQRATIKRELPKILANPVIELQDWDVLARLHSELLRAEEEISFYDEKLSHIRRQIPLCQRLQTIPGVGPLTAVAIVASTNPRDFKSGRQFAAFLGLVPKQHSSGGQARLLGMSKRGNVYLRTLLIHGARAAIRWSKGKLDRTNQWVTKLCERRGMNKATVALARKQAIVAWVIATREVQYRTFAA